MTPFLQALPRVEDSPGYSTSRSAHRVSHEVVTPPSTARDTIVTPTPLRFPSGSLSIVKNLESYSQPERAPLATTDTIHLAPAPSDISPITSVLYDSLPQQAASPTIDAMSLRSSSTLPPSYHTRRSDSRSYQALFFSRPLPPLPPEPTERWGNSEPVTTDSPDLGRRRARDGGVRMDGGRLGELPLDLEHAVGLMEEGESTRPPSYV